MKKWLVTLLAIVVLSATIAGCSYHHQNFDQTGGRLSGPDDFVIQIDDYGQLWDRKPATDALAKVKLLSQRTNVIVLLFVHGWNHSASPDSENVNEFAQTLAKARELLTNRNNPQSSVYRASRLELTGIEEVTVVGIYVGWRGRSLPWLFNYATFWGRKAAAERVGQGDLREFMYELNAIYKDTRSRREQGIARNFMGLASIGHSFGGQVLFKSVASELENELTLAAQPSPRANTAEVSKTRLYGFGDLVVLVNPAMEALQFERIRRLSEKLAYSKLQGPVLLVVSSAGDVPRQVLFPIGRGLDALFRPGFREGQRALWTEALGEYEPYRTHTLDILPEESKTPPFDPHLYLTDSCAIATYDLSNVPSIANVRLTPTARQTANNPFLVAYASTEVVMNHHKIFEDTLRMFLTDYVAIAQGKTILASDPKLKCN